MRPTVTQLETRRNELDAARQPAGGDPATRPVATAATPPRYKLALLTWVAAYSVITLLLAVFGPAMASWPLAVRTLALSVVMVGTLTWVVMPRLTRLFGPWLRPSG